MRGIGRLLAISALLAVSAGVLAFASGAAAGTAEERPGATAETDEHVWSVSALATRYTVPAADDYVQSTLAADRDWLHLEARHNYEDRATASAWIGYNFGFGEEVAFGVTPMLGGVFGNTSGIAPGYEASIDYRRLSLYSECEYVIDTGDSSSNFLYTWSELTLAPVEWLRFGMAIERTKAYRTEFDIQRGPLVGVSFGRSEITLAVFGLGEDPTIIIGAGLDL